MDYKILAFIASVVVLLIVIGVLLYRALKEEHKKHDEWREDQNY